MAVETIERTGTPPDPTTHDARWRAENHPSVGRIHLVDDRLRGADAPDVRDRVRPG